VGESKDQHAKRHQSAAQDPRACGAHPREGHPQSGGHAGGAGRGGAGTFEIFQSPLLLSCADVQFTVGETETPAFLWKEPLNGLIHESAVTDPQVEGHHGGRL